MSSSHDFDKVISAIYDAGLDVTLIPDSLAAISAIADAWGCGQWSVDPSTGAVLYMHGHGHSPEGELAYREYYYRIDPGTAVTTAEQPGKWVLDQQLLNPDDPAHREYFFDYCSPNEVRWVAGTVLLAAPTQHIVFSMQRSARQGPFAPDQARLLDRLLPHLRRSAIIQQRLGNVLADQRLLVDVLDGLRAAMCIVDVLGHVRYLNRAAEALLASGRSLRLRQGRLCGTDQTNDSLLRKGLSLACGQPACAFSGRLPDPDPQGLQVVFSPLGDRIDVVRQDLRLAERLALVMLGTVPRSVLPLDALRQMFGLTQAEARLTQALATGEDLAGIARRTNVSIATLRTQLSAALGKSSTSSQAQLVALVKTLPAIG